MGIDGRGGRSSDGSRVHLLGLLLLVLALFPKEAISGLVNGPSHVVLAPIEGIFSNLLAPHFPLVSRKSNLCFAMDIMAS